jgi:ABC-2 type transport system ATP-binding protein
MGAGLTAMVPTPMNLLALRDLSHAYGTRPALETLSLEMPWGSVGLLGPNGAGKSTLLKILMGLMRPSSGEATLMGLDCHRDRLAIRARVGYVSENETLIPGLSAVEFVALAGELSGMRRGDSHRRAHEILAHLGVEESRYRKIETLSTGVRQRVAMAQALVTDPDLLILDEPTNGLDPSGRRAMLDLIRRLHLEFGKSVVLSSHLLDDVDRVCDSVMILRAGRVLAHGRKDFLRGPSEGRFLLRLSGESTVVVERLRNAGAQVRSEVVRSAGDVELLLEVPAGFAMKSIFAAIREVPVPQGGAAPRLQGLVPQEDRLEDVFRRILQAEEGTRGD